MEFMNVDSIAVRLPLVLSDERTARLLALLENRGLDPRYYEAATGTEGFWLTLLEEQESRKVSPRGHAGYCAGSLAMRLQEVTQGEPISAWRSSKLGRYGNERTPSLAFEVERSGQVGLLREACVDFLRENGGDTALLRDFDAHVTLAKSRKAARYVEDTELRKDLNKVVGERLEFGRPVVEYHCAVWDIGRLTVPNAAEWFQVEAV